MKYFGPVSLKGNAMWMPKKDLEDAIDLLSEA